MHLTHIIDELIHILDSSRHKGTGYIEISQDNKFYLSDSSTSKQKNASNFEQTNGRDEHDESKNNQKPVASSSISAVEDPHSPYNSRQATVSDRPDLQVPPPNTKFQLDELQKVVEDCRRCQLSTCRVPSECSRGSHTAELMFIGDSPAHFDEKVTMLFDKIVAAMKYSLNEVYFTTVIKCCSPEKRQLADEEITACLPYLHREIELVNPKVIVLFGAIPLKYLLGKVGLVKYRGQWNKLGLIDCITTFHPSYLLRIPQAKRDVWNDMKLVMNRLDQLQGNQKK